MHAWSCQSSREEYHLESWSDPSWTSLRWQQTQRWWERKRWTSSTFLQMPEKSYRWQRHVLCGSCSCSCTTCIWTSSNASNIASSAQMSWANLARQRCSEFGPYTPHHPKHSKAWPCPWNSCSKRHKDNSCIKQFHRTCHIALHSCARIQVVWKLPKTMIELWFTEQAKGRVSRCGNRIADAWTHAECSESLYQNRCRAIL